MLERIPRFRYLIYYISYRYIMFTVYENFLNFQIRANIRAPMCRCNLYHIYMSGLKTFYFIFSSLRLCLCLGIKYFLY